MFNLFPFISFLVLIPAIAADVFISCRDDIPISFTDHLHTALIEAGIRTYRNDDAGTKAEENIGLAINRAIYESKVCVIVFSKGFASSMRCLDELVMIMEHRRTSDGYIVVPVFYDVDPSDIGDLTGIYGKAFDEHEKLFMETMDRVEGWKTALKEAADIKGIFLKNRNEPQFIQHIVREVQVKLNLCKGPKVASYFSGNDLFLFKLMGAVGSIVALVFLSENKKAMYVSAILIMEVVKWLCFFNEAEAGSSCFL